MSHDELKPYLPPSRAEYAKRQQEAITRITQKSTAFGSTLDREYRDGLKVCMIWLAKTGQRVLVTIEHDGLYTGKLITPEVA